MMAWSVNVDIVLYRMGQAVLFEHERIWLFHLRIAANMKLLNRSERNEISMRYPALAI